MRLLLINPNTTASMTEKIGAAARDVEDGVAAAEGLVALKLGTSQSGPFARTLAA